MVKTWHLEAVFIGSVLVFSTILLTDAQWYDWVGVGAVFLASRHMSVADRLREKEESIAGTHGNDVECVRWLNRYWAAKEVLFLVYFFSVGATAAVVGSVVFFLYPFWRGYYRRNG